MNKPWTEEEVDQDCCKCSCGNFTYFVVEGKDYFDFVCGSCGVTIRVLRASAGPKGDGRDWTGCCC